jgi:hypothetical protein
MKPEIIEVFAKSMTAAERKEMLSELKKKTTTRKNKEGADDILLHRGMDDDEHRTFVKDNQCHHHTCKEKKQYEWSTNKKDADDYAEQCKKAKKKGHSISAWIPEQDVQSTKLGKSMTPAAPSPVSSSAPNMSSNPYNDVSRPMSDGGSLTQIHTPAFQSQTSAFVAPSMPAEINGGSPTLSVTKSYNAEEVLDPWSKSFKNQMKTAYNNLIKLLS